MSEDDKSTTLKDGGTAEAAAAKLVDDASQAADATRSTAKWVATALAAIPALGAFGALVRAPGDAGFDEVPLFIGIALAALAAIVGTLAIASVLAPATMSDQDLRAQSFDIRKVPNHPFASYGALLASLADVRSAVANDEVRASDRKVDAAVAEANAASADADLVTAEQALAADPNNGDLQKALSAARLRRDGARATARQSASTAVAYETGLKLLQDQLEARETVRARALQLAAAEKVSERYQGAIGAVVLTVALGALAVYALAIAPRAKVESGTSTSLVTVTLNDVGRATLNCDADSVQALRVGGTDEAPQLVTLPTPECPATLVNFRVAEPMALGSLVTATPAPAPTTTPTPTSTLTPTPTASDS